MQSTAISGLRACPSCGALNATRFCGECGHSIDAAPKRAAEVLREGATELFGIDRAVLRTVRDLLLHPLRVADAVRSGNEAGYVRPFRLFFLLAGVYILLQGTVQPHSFEMTQQVPPNALAVLVEVAKGNGITPEMMNARYEQRLNMLLPLISAAMLLPLALMLRRMDRTRGVGDHVLCMASVTNSMWIVCIMLTPLALAGKWVFIAAAQVVGIAYISAAIVGLYHGATKVSTALRLVTFLVVDYTLTIALSMLMLLGVVFSVLFF